MELVFDIVNRGGHSLARHRVSGEEITIGRAFDNSLILSDDSVDPHHARIRLTADGELEIVDCDSLNGIKRHTTRLNGSARFGSGDTFSFGRTRLRVFTPDHSVAPARSLGGADGMMTLFSRTSVFVGLAMLALLVTLFQIWSDSFSSLRWQDFGVGVVSIVIVCLLIATVFAIVGRITKHEAHFRMLLGIVLAYLLAQSVIVFFYELLLYNSLNYWLSLIAGTCLSFALLGLTWWLCLQISTNLSSRKSMMLALVFSLFMLGFSIYPELETYLEFSGTPRYVKEIKPPSLLLRQPVQAPVFIQSSTDLFEQTNVMTNSRSDG